MQQHQPEPGILRGPLQAQAEHGTLRYLGGIKKSGGTNSDPDSVVVKAEKVNH